MTPAELKTLREACGLSLPQLAAISGVQERTARYWENGHSKVPDDVANLIQFIETQLTTAANQVISTQVQPGLVTLLRYRTQADLSQFHPRPSMINVTPNVYAAMLHRVYSALQAQGIPCRIIYMDPEAYAAWLIATAQTDTEATRSAWAALQPTP